MATNEERGAALGRIRAKLDRIPDSDAVMLDKADVLAVLAAVSDTTPSEQRVMLRHPDGTPKSNDELREEAAALRPTPSKGEREALAESECLMTDFLSRARETAEREAEERVGRIREHVGFSDNDSTCWRQGFADGFTTAASRLPREEEFAGTVAQFWDANDSPTDVARAVRELIEKKFVGDPD